MLPSFYWLTVGTLCVWRITHLLHIEDGPWEGIARLRRMLDNSVFGQLLDCFYCLSLWISAPVAYALGTSCTERLWLWPALSGAAILLERFAQKPPTIIGGEIGDPDHVMLREKQGVNNETDESQL